MKKIFTSLLTMVAFAVSAMATDYKDIMTVTVNGVQATPTENTISIEDKGENGYTLSLKNFVMYMEGEPMPVGTIVLENVGATANGEVTTLKTNQEITITEGDDPNFAGQWLGPILSATGELIPVNLVGEIRGDKFYTVINIYFSEMDIKVVFGNGGYQIENSGFENFHTATYVDGKKEYTSEEPNAWHSFNSGVATGENANLTKYALQNGNTSVSEEVRPGSTGTKSVAIKSAKVNALGLFKVAANGTMTTGRLQAGSIIANNSGNCSFLDMSSTDLDGNGDPFYTVLNGQPDALSVWVKYKQGEINEKYPYATISAVITDGTYYQDPEDKTYTNVVAKAQNKTIESKDFEWQNLVIPFDYNTYTANTAESKALLVTISTNAEPGVASNDDNNPDIILVDDIELVYNSQLASLKVKGADVEGFNKDEFNYDLTAEGAISVDDIEAVSDGQGAYVTKSVEDVDGGVKVTITVTSNDLQTTNVYTLNIAGATTTGINKIETTTGKGTAAIYNVNGQRVNNMSQKGLYIIRQADGKTVKVLKK